MAMPIFYMQSKIFCTFAWRTQYVSGLKDWILSCRSTQKPSVGVWHGPNEIKEESRLPYFPWKYLVWNLKKSHKTQACITCMNGLSISFNQTCKERN